MTNHKHPLGVLWILKAIANYGTHSSCFYNLVVSVSIPGKFKTEAVRNKEDENTVENPPGFFEPLWQDIPVGHDVLMFILFSSLY